MKEQTFVHGETEVVLTGRVAKRKIPGRRGGADKFDIKVEIKPKSDEDGSWNKFVYEKELYEIEDSE